MITLEHGRNRMGLRYVACEALQRDTAALCYAAGYTKPNYPVPAIPDHVGAFSEWYLNDDGFWNMPVEFRARAITETIKHFV